MTSRRADQVPGAIQCVCPSIPIHFRSARRALQAIVVLVLWGLITHGTHAGTGDEPHYLAIAHSIAFDGDLDLANNYGANEPLVGGGVLQPEAHVRPGVGGDRAAGPRRRAAARCSRPSSASRFRSRTR